MQGGMEREGGFLEETDTKDMRCDLCRKSPLKGIRVITVDISDFCSHIHKLCFLQWISTSNLLFVHFFTC